MQGESDITKDGDKRILSQIAKIPQTLLNELSEPIIIPKRNRK